MLGRLVLLLFEGMYVWFYSRVWAFGRGCGDGYCNLYLMYGIVLSQGRGVFIVGGCLLVMFVGCL